MAVPLPNTIGMGVGKTNKSFTKRLRITKSGKVLARHVGKNHFNAKKSRSKQLAHKSMRSFTIKSKLLASLTHSSK